MRLHPEIGDCLRPRCAAAEELLALAAYAMRDKPSPAAAGATAMQVPVSHVDVREQDVTRASRLLLQCLGWPVCCYLKTRIYV